jgi:hypothetical protein
MKEYREEGFPVTIVRPSHTYCERSVPLSVHGLKGSWQVVKRMILTTSPLWSWVRCGIWSAIAVTRKVHYIL